MAIDLRKIEGNWDAGYALDKHVVSSVYTGDSEAGRPLFDTKRTPVGEAVYQLKYRSSWVQVPRLARAVVKYIVPLFDEIGLVVPMPASMPRFRQPVIEVAMEIGKLLDVDTATSLLIKKEHSTKEQLKNLRSKDEKVAALSRQLEVAGEINAAGPVNVLLIDDLFDTGASMEAACASLRTLARVEKVFVAALTWT